jgi:hypothetical protein
MYRAGSSRLRANRSENVRKDGSNLEYRRTQSYTANLCSWSALSDIGILLFAYL